MNLFCINVVLAFPILANRDHEGEQTGTPSLTNIPIETLFINCIPCQVQLQFYLGLLFPTPIQPNFSIHFPGHLPFFPHVECTLCNCFFLFSLTSRSLFRHTGLLTSLPDFLSPGDFQLLHFTDFLKDLPGLFYSPVPEDSFTGNLPDHLLEETEVYLCV